MRVAISVFCPTGCMRRAIGAECYGQPEKSSKIALSTWPAPSCPVFPIVFFNKPYGAPPVLLFFDVEKSIEKGEALLLQRLLVCSFGALPSEVVARVAAASAQPLEFWGDRVLEAPGQEGVFRM